MIYTPLTQKAMILAYKAHHGQVDKFGVPYIYHSLHLAEQMTSELTCCAALLHDVVEDTPMTLEDLARDFPQEVLEALALLTHDPATDYMDYIRAITANPIAKAVKLADLAHNSDATRLSGCSPELAAWHSRKRAQYARARALLLGLED